MTAPNGVDVSRYQGNVDWAQVKRSGVQFAVCKATESTGYVDSYFARNWAGIRAAGLQRSAYHFARPEKSSGQAQAEWFVSVVGKLAPDDLPLVLDLEASKLSGSQTVTWAVDFLNRLDQLTGKHSIIYTGPGFVNSLGTAVVRLTTWPLWVAHYTTRDHPDYAPWSEWLWWQHSSDGQVPGVAGRVDVNRAAAMPAPVPIPPVEEDMPRAVRSDKSGATFVMDAGQHTIWKVTDPADLDVLYFLGEIKPDKGNVPATVSSDFLSRFRSLD